MCNVNNKPELLPIERNGAGDWLTNVRIKLTGIMIKLDFKSV